MVKARAVWAGLTVLLLAFSVQLRAQGLPPDWPPIGPDESVLILLLGTELEGRTLIVSDSERRLDEAVVTMPGHQALHYRVKPGVYEIHSEWRAEPRIWVAEPGAITVIWLGGPVPPWFDAPAALGTGEIETAPALRIEPVGGVLYLNTEPPWPIPPRPLPGQPPPAQ